MDVKLQTCDRTYVSLNFWKWSTLKLHPTGPDHTVLKIRAQKKNLSHSFPLLGPLWLRGFLGLLKSIRGVWEKQFRAPKGYGVAFTTEGELEGAWFSQCSLVYGVLTQEAQEILFPAKYMVLMLVLDVTHSGNKGLLWGQVEFWESWRISGWEGDLVGRVLAQNTQGCGFQSQRHIN